MRTPTLYMALPFYLNSLKHLKNKHAGGYGQIKGTLNPDNKIKPFQIRTISGTIKAIEIFEALECNLNGDLSGNVIDLVDKIDQLAIQLLNGKVYIINPGIPATLSYTNYVLHLSYDGNEYYSELVTQFSSGIPNIPEIADSYIIDATTATGIQFYDSSIIISSVGNEGTAILAISNNKIIVTVAGTIAGLSITDDQGVNYYFPIVENMHTIHCVDTGQRAILNNYSWSTNGNNYWNLYHGATKLTATDGRIGFIPYTRDRQKLIVI